MTGPWLDWALEAQTAGMPLPEVLATVADGPGRPPLVLDGRVIEPTTGRRPVEPVPPGRLGQVHEALLATGERRRRGAFYTPADLARGLVAAVVEESVTGPVVDPACGGGAFLLASGRRLVELGAGPAEQVARRWLFGADTDRMAVAVARWTVAEWAGVNSDDVVGLVVGDPLTDGRSAWAPQDRDGFATVVGNPPFLGQLRRGTAYESGRRAVLREVYGDLVGPYTDAAWLFLACGLRLLHPGGRMVLVQPQSLLSARDAGPVRRHLLGEGRLTGLWFDTSGVFAGRSEVCAPVVEKAASDGPVRLLIDRSVKSAGTVPSPGPDDPWGVLVAGLLGIPRVGSVDAGTVADRASVTAGFRQHFYGLIPAVGEASVVRGPAPRPLVTTALVDPLLCRWGSAPARFAGRRWNAPVVDESAVALADPEVAEWLVRRHRPKLLVATQTRVVEVVVDPDGAMVPATPLVIVEPDEADLWLLAAALSAPPVTARAAVATLGTARSAGRIKLAARQVAGLSLPVDRAAWEEGAAAARDLWIAGEGASPESWRAFGVLMCRAYREDPDPLVAWWWERHPAAQHGGAGTRCGGRATKA